MKSLEEIAQAYDSPPWWYDARGFFILTFCYRSTIGFQVRFFERNISPEHLEVAIGSGSLLEIILRWSDSHEHKRIVGIDYAMPMLAGAIKRFKAYPQVELKHADVTQMPFDEATFTSVSIANAIHCFPDINAALRDIFRVLKPGGTLATNVLLYAEGRQPMRWVAQSIMNWGMRKGILFTPYHLNDIKKRLTSVGFRIIYEVREGNTYNVVAQKPPPTAA